jgi:hypothetical protein
MLLRLKKSRWSSPNIIITIITIITITTTTITTTIIIITTTITIIIITREMMPEAAPFLSEEDLPAFAAANPQLWFGFSWRLALSLRKTPILSY